MSPNPLPPEDGGQCPLGVTRRFYPEDIHQGCQREPPGILGWHPPQGWTHATHATTFEITLESWHRFWSYSNTELQASQLPAQLASLGAQGCGDVKAICLMITKEGALHVPGRGAHWRSCTNLLHSVDGTARAIFSGGELGKTRA